MRLPRSLTVLRDRTISILWFSQVFSAFGDRFHEIAIVWYSIQLIGSEAGFILAGGSLARLAFGLFGGVLADRWNRQRILVTVDLVRAAAVATLPLAAILGQLSLTHLAVVAIIVGGLSAIFEPSLQASLPDLAHDSATLQATNGLMDVTSRLARVFAPGLAGLIIAWIPLAHFFSIDAVTFLVSALAILALHNAFPVHFKPEVIPGEMHPLRRVARDIGGAFHLVYANRPVFWGLIAITLMNMTWNAAFTVGVALFTQQRMQGDVGAYGLLVAAYGVGNVLSNLVVGSLTIRHRVRTLFLGKIILGLGFWLFTYSTSLPAAMVCMATAAIGGPMGDIMLLLMIQEEFPADQIGKIYSTRMTLSSAGASLGLMLAGPLFNSMAVTTGITLCAVLMLLIGFTGTIRFLREG
ncbi:MAG: MFS transporter [Chloroflexi bacterium]|nr:MFS transporter [Anaerolineaceae bacterium]NMB89974.1 MFS transporter [Chloroflexota bacterium]